MTQEIDLSEILPEAMAEDFTHPLLQSLKNESAIKIKDIKVAEAKYGKYAVVTLKNGKVYRTSATYLVEKLEALSEVKPDGAVVSATLYHKVSDEGNTYYILK